jgi:hypothetical protein
MSRGHGASSGCAVKARRTARKLPSPTTPMAQRAGQGWRSAANTAATAVGLTGMARSVCGKAAKAA